MLLSTCRDRYDQGMSEERKSLDPKADPTSAEAGAAAPESTPGGELLRGTTVAPGLALGTAHRKDYDLSRSVAERVPLDAVEIELNRFRRALEDSRLQLSDLKSRLAGKVQADDSRILDTHLAYLSDSVFIADVENLILNEQMRLEAAIGKVVADFDRIFRLVQNERLRESAVDLRDVGIRVLRNLEEARAAQSGPGAAPPTEYILVARELSIVDMFNLKNEHVRGIVTREGGLTSHAAIFARSMRIPTITGVEGLLDLVQEGDFLILDATEGVLRVNPQEVVRSQYARSAAEVEEEAAGEGEIPDWALRPTRTLDGEAIEISPSCGNLPEVEQAAALGQTGVGLYRTELLYLVESTPPSRDSLVQHYAAVVAGARGGAVTFRLLNVDSSVNIAYLYPRREENPALGRAGIRALLAHENVLRRQLQAILLAGAAAEIRIAVPFVSDCGELRRVKEILFEERFELRKAGLRFQDGVEIGVVIETPAAMLGIRDLASESDFMLLNLDSLQQYILATDRDHAELATSFDTLHPFVLRALAKANEVASGERKPLGIFGVSAVRPELLPLLIGTGFRRFCVPPGVLREFLSALVAIDSKQATRRTRAAAKSSSAAETRSLVVGYRHGYARP